MLAWVIVLLVLLLILSIPLGADAAYGPDGYCIKLKIGPFRKKLLPGMEISRPKKKKPAKPETEQTEKKPQKRKLKLKLDLDDLIELAKIVLRSLRRFGMRLDVDLLQLDWTAAAADPYDAVLQYGGVNALLGIISGPVHNVFSIRSEDIRTGLDLEASRPVISARVVASIQIWELLYIAICAGASAVWQYLKKKREQRTADYGDAGKEPV